MKKLQGNEEAKKKWENFWYYYKYHVLAGVFILVCIIVFAKDMLSKIDYDYCVSVVGSYAVPEEDKAALQKWFEEHGEDLNEDGEIHVQVQIISFQVRMMRDLTHKCMLPARQSLP